MIIQKTNLLLNNNDSTISTNKFKNNIHGLI